MELDYGLWLSPWVLGIFGLCIGSFLNVVIYRLPVMMDRDWHHEAAAMLVTPDELVRVGGIPKAEAEKFAKAVDDYGTRIEQLPPLSLASPPSRCPHCGHKLRWHENLPVIGWLRLGGKCAECKAPVSKRYPIIEALTGIAFAALSWRFGAQPTTLLWCGFVAALIALAMIDWDTTLLPDSINQPLLWAGLIASLMGWTIPIDKALIGAVAGYLSLWSVAWVYQKVRGQVGMAPGDFKLLAALGAWLGWPMLLPVILGASAVGAVVGLGMKMSASLREGRYVPFGPFLAGGGLVVLFAGPQTVLGWMGWA